MASPNTLPGARFCTSQNSKTSLKASKCRRPRVDPSSNSVAADGCGWPIFPRSSERTGKEEEKWQNHGWQNHKKGGTLRPLVTFAAIPILIFLPVYLSASSPFAYLSRFPDPKTFH